ncbi:MAG: DUF523 domain-containing protein [Candidatus Omnitrophota bacterium]|jgi:uncharacterized protein YbbK (DUF523 family)
MPSQYKILVSACLAGANCTYRGDNNLNPKILKMVNEGLAIPACPEVLGGLGIPREKSEIIGGNGKDVLEKKARVVTLSGRDVTANFVSGAKKARSLIKKYHIKKAVLKSNSPSCGLGQIYNGTFRNIPIKGDGVTAAILKLSGVKCLKS